MESDPILNGRPPLDYLQAMYYFQKGIVKKWNKDPRMKAPDLAMKNRFEAYVSAHNDLWKQLQAARKERRKMGAFQFFRSDDCIAQVSLHCICQRT